VGVAREGFNPAEQRTENTVDQRIVPSVQGPEVSAQPETMKMQTWQKAAIAAGLALLALVAAKKVGIL
jgi:hypothetical protein